LNEKIGIFYGHVEYIMAIWFILWPAGKLGNFWYISLRLGTLNKEKSGNPDADRKRPDEKQISVF
jgi:hypothetical protein